MKRLYTLLTLAIVLGVGALSLALSNNYGQVVSHASAEMHTNNETAQPILDQTSRLWQQPSWFRETNEHGTVSVRMANGGNVPNFNRHAVNAFHRFGWDVPSLWNTGAYWTLDLNYNITIHRISFDAHLSVAPNDPSRTTPMTVSMFGQTQSYQPVGTGARIRHFSFELDAIETNQVDILLHQIRSPITEDNWNGSTNTTLFQIRSLTIEATVNENHHSAFNPERKDTYLEIGTHHMLARDFELNRDGGWITFRMTIDGYPVGFHQSFNQILIQDFGRHTGHADHRVVNIPIDQFFTGFWVRFEGDRFNFFDRHYFLASPDSVLEIEIGNINFTASTPNTGGTGHIGTISGWFSEPQTRERILTVTVIDLNFRQLGVIRHEMNLSGIIGITSQWLVNQLPQLNVDGQIIDGFFWVRFDPEPYIDTSWVIRNLHINFFHTQDIVLAIDFIQITHTITFRQTFGSSEIIELGVHTFNWGEAIPDPATLFPDLEQRRGWVFNSWSHSPFQWSPDWTIIPIIGTPLTQDIVFTASMWRLNEWTLRFFVPIEQSGGWIHDRMMYVTTIYEDESFDYINTVDWVGTPLSQLEFDIPVGYEWSGQWISTEGFLVGHILDNNPIERPFGTSLSFLHFVPHLVPIEYMVSFMSHDGSYLARVQTIGGYIDPNSIPNLPHIEGMEFSHWFNSSGLNFNSRILSDTHFWAVYVPTNAPPPVDPPIDETDPDPNNPLDDLEIEPWMLAMGVAGGLVIILIFATALSSALKPKKRRRY